MDQNLITTAVILGAIWYMTTKDKAPQPPPFYPIGPVKNPNPVTMPTTPLTAPIAPIQPHARPLSGTCLSVTDKAYPPFAPNIKNNCPNNTFKWELVNNPSLQQCRTYVGPNYTNGLGGCFIPNQPGGAKTLFLLVNSGK